MSSLKLVKLTKSQAHAVAEIANLMFGAHRRAMKRRETNPDAEYSIPLTKLYRRYNRKCRDAVLATVMVFFERSSRGSNITGKTSSWVPRQNFKMNKRIADLLIELYDLNLEHMESVYTYAHSKDSDEVTVTTTYKFASAKQAQVFSELILPYLNATRDEQIDNTSAAQAT